MALSPNEIKSRVIQFVEEHKNDSQENSHKQIFWNDFFGIFGIKSSQLGTFEERAKTLRGNTGYIDYFWPGTLLIEHKSRGEDLDEAYKQALDYLLAGGVKEHEKPKFIIVSDFEKIRIIEFNNYSNKVEFKTKDLLENFHHFNFILGYDQRVYRDEDPVNIKASALMGELHDEFEALGFEGHELRLMLVRLMFCFFADDTGIFPKDEFLFYMQNKTREDGSDLGAILNNFFILLNTDEAKRPKNLDPDLVRFPYVNGELFAEIPSMVSFSKSLREKLIHCCEFDWSKVSPAIFGSLFQSVMNKVERRTLGAHYTSEKNILKTIHGLFLDELVEEFESLKSKKSIKGLEDLLARIRKIKILDPACGCGNFLILSYRELRILEMELLKAISDLRRGLVKDYRELNISWLDGLDVDMLYGIEIEEFPALIAKTAIWIMDHLMNTRASNLFGGYFARLPLKKAPHITIANALRVKWEEVIRPEELSYILGNPPFVGKQIQNQSQKDDMNFVFAHLGLDYGVLDYVYAWYARAVEYIGNNSIDIALVSTNSITQGEQPSVIWPYIFSHNFHIKFAHQTFRWTNEAKGQAAVHCIIIGLSKLAKRDKKIFIYDNIAADPKVQICHNISPYLVKGSSLVIGTAKHPLCRVPELQKGSQPTDDGNLLLSEKEFEEYLKSEPEGEKYIKRFISAKEFLNNSKRYCFWLVGVEPSSLRNLPLLKEKISNVMKFRKKSSKAATVKWADSPYLFTENRQPITSYIIIPRHSSESRLYIPMGFQSENEIVGDSCISLPGATLYHFGVMQSLIHMAWVRRICGRIKSDYRYSNDIVYNNFPWPENPTEKQKKEIESLAQLVLDARAQFPESSLADLYDPLTMPKVLRDAHNKLDKAVDKAYRSKPFQTESERVEFLFELYEKYTNTLTSQIKVPRKKKS